MLKFFDHYRGLAISIVLGLILIFAVAVPGCSPTVQSPWSGDRVTRAQLDAEAADQVRQLEIEQQALAARAEGVRQRHAAAVAELERQEAFVHETLGAVREAIATIPDPWGGVAGTVAGLIALGLGYDTRRKDHVIEEIKSGR